MAMARGAPSKPCPPLCPPCISPGHEAQLSALVAVLARDVAYLDGLNRELPTPGIDFARPQKHKYGLCDLVKAILKPLAAKNTAHLARDAARARSLARHVVWREQQLFEAAIGGHIARGVSVLIRDLENLAGQQPPRPAPGLPGGAAGAVASPPQTQGGATPAGASHLPRRPSAPRTR